jgi:RNA polymerase sigma-70 factor (ECF subfamily)
MNRPHVPSLRSDSAGSVLLATPSDSTDPFVDLYTEFGKSVYARCRRILRDAAAAEDATQEVFSRIHEHLGRIPGKRAALAWLYRTATNHCLNEVRNGRTRALLVRAVPEPREPDAEIQLWQRDLVVHLVRELPAALALAAWLYHVDGLEQAEIAMICGVSRRTVISRLARFAEKARELVAGSDLYN